MSSQAGTAAASQATAAGAVTQAIKASGSIVRVDQEAFEQILQRTDRKLVIACPARTKLFGRHQYAVNYQGFTFYLKHKELIQIPPGFEIIEAKRIWVPY